MTSAPETPEASALLQVTVLHARDAAAAADGQADRLLLLREPEAAASPEAATVSAVVRESGLPVRVLLRGESVERMAARAEEYAALGAEGVVVSLLDRDLRIDAEACRDLAARVRLPWCFGGFDAVLDADRGWADVRALPWLDGVVTAGSVRGMAVGGEDLIRRAAADRGIARLVLAAGGLQAEQVPWLVRAGVRQFGIASSARQDGSWTRAYVDAGRVRAWRMLVDDALARAQGIAVE